MKKPKVSAAGSSAQPRLFVEGAYAKLTPSADAYTSTAAPTTNYGAKTLLGVESASQTTFIRFDLSSIPADYAKSSPVTN